jgi:hypothetical protein
MGFLPLQASAVVPHGQAEVFEVSLEASSLDQSFPSRVDNGFGRAQVEPMGMFLIPNTTYSALEGRVVSSSYIATLRGEYQYCQLPRFPFQYGGNLVLWVMWL